MDPARQAATHHPEILERPKNTDADHGGDEDKSKQRLRCLASHGKLRPGKMSESKRETGKIVSTDEERQESS